MNVFLLFSTYYNGEEIKMLLFHISWNSFRICAMIPWLTDSKNIFCDENVNKLHPE